MGAERANLVEQSRPGAIEYFPLPGQPACEIDGRPFDPRAGADDCGAGCVTIGDVVDRTVTKELIERRLRHAGQIVKRGYHGASPPPGVGYAGVGYAGGGA